MFVRRSFCSVVSVLVRSSVNRCSRSRISSQGSVTKGRVEYTEKDGKKQFDIEGGFVEVKRNEVNLCVEV